MSLPPRRCRIEPPDAWDRSLSIGDELDFEQQFLIQFRSSATESGIRLSRLRIISKRAEDPRRLQEVRFELLDDFDVYYYGESLVTAQKYTQIKDSGFLADFNDFPGAVAGLVRDCLKPSSNMSMTFWEESDRSGVLTFSHEMNLRTTEILRLPFRQTNPEFVRSQLQFRYESLRYRCAIQKRMLSELKQQLHAHHFRIEDPESPQRK